jgi:hypothetical protein
MTTSSELSTTLSQVVPFTVLLTVFTATAGSAQDFGHNKVHEKNFDFQVLETEHFDIHFDPAARAAADISARLAERWYARLSQIFDHELRGRQMLVLCGSHPDFEQTNLVQQAPTHGARGMTDAVFRRIVLPFGGRSPTLTMSSDTSWCMPFNST